MTININILNMLLECRVHCFIKMQCYQVILLYSYKLIIFTYISCDSTGSSRSGRVTSKSDVSTIVSMSYSYLKINLKNRDKDYEIDI